MEEALRKIEQQLRERQTASRIDGLLPKVAAGSAAASGDLGIEHYGKVSMAAEGGGSPVEQPRPEPKPAPMDAGSRIAAGSRELNLDELSSQTQSGSEALKTQQLGGTRFHELSLDDLSSPPAEDKSGAN